MTQVPANHAPAGYVATPAVRHVCDGCAFIVPSDDCPKVANGDFACIGANRQDGKSVIFKAAESDVSQAIAAEREACAKLCEQSDRYRGDYFAYLIRSRGKA